MSSTFPLTFLLQVQNNMGSSITTATTQLETLGTAGATAGTGIESANTAMGTGTTSFSSKLSKVGGVITTVGPQIAALATSATFLAFALDAVSKAQLRVDKASQQLKDRQDAVVKLQEKYNAAVAKFGVDSPQAIAALDNLKDAQNKVKLATTNLELKQKDLNESYIALGTSVASTVISGLSGVMGLIGTIKDVFPGASGAVDTLKTAFSGLGGGTGVLGALGGAITGLGFALAFFKDAVAGFQVSGASFNIVADALSGDAEGVKTNFLEMNKAFGGMSVLAPLMEPLQGFINMIAESHPEAFVAFNNAVQTMGIALSNVGKALTTVFTQKFPAWWNGFVTSVTTTVASAFSSFGSALGTVATNLKALFDLKQPPWWSDLTKGKTTAGPFGGNIGDLFKKQSLGGLGGGFFNVAEAAGPGGKGAGAGGGFKLPALDITAFTSSIASASTTFALFVNFVKTTPITLAIPNTTAFRAGMDAAVLRYTQAQTAIQGTPIILPAPNITTFNTGIDAAARRYTELQSAIEGTPITIPINNGPALKAIGVVVNNIQNMQRIGNAAKITITVINSQALSAISRVVSAIKAIPSSKTVNIKTVHTTVNKTVRAAQGFHSIVNAPTTFLAGEKGPESVDITPLSGRERTSTMRTYGNSLKRSAGGGGPIIVQTFLDGRLLAQSVAKNMSQTQGSYK